MCLSADVRLAPASLRRISTRWFIPCIASRSRPIRCSPSSHSSSCNARTSSRHHVITSSRHHVITSSRQTDLVRARIAGGRGRPKRSRRPSSRLECVLGAFEADARNVNASLEASAAAIARHQWSRAGVV